jgi:hypothetical protein
MLNANDLLGQAMSWLRTNYQDLTFFVERDVVYAIQVQVAKLIHANKLPYKVYNDFPMLPGKNNRRSVCTDIAIVNAEGFVEIAIEFKYEPSHIRTDLLKSKFTPTVVFWGNDGVAKDIARVKNYVELKKAKIAHAILIDEGQHFRTKPPHPDSKWINWENGVAILHSSFKAT